MAENDYILNDLKSDNLSDEAEINDFKDKSMDKTVILDTSSGLKDGQEKCPKCGATDISLNTSNGKLRCEFCRYEFESEKIKTMEEDISKLKGKVIGSGAKNIEDDVENVVTLKCQSCGAEVVIDSLEASQSRCHWCRNTLSLNQQIPNGSIPDMLLPFKIKKDQAKMEIEKFVSSRKYFAHPKFKEEFTSDNIMGVYFPYMIVDINGHSYLEGVGELNKRTYKVKNGDKEENRYDVDVYNVSRKFDIRIKDLSIESSSDKLDKKSKEKTNYIINSIMPFDTENCVKWNANYIKGYTSEKRDVNVDQLEDIVERQSRDIAKFKINDTLSKYDRGVRWDTNKLDIEGQQWNAAYLPVWLYSYQEKKGEKSLLHYIAVNARTKETMGSIPIYMPKLILTSIVLEIIGIFMMLFIDFGEEFSGKWAFLLPGLIFFFYVYLKYRNTNARHTYELETVTEIENILSEDVFVKTNLGVKQSSMVGANNKTLEAG